MKRLFLALVCCALPFAFVGCDDDDDDILDPLTGTMSLTIDGSAHSYKGVGAYTQNGKTYIATMTSDNAVAIQLSGTKTGSYTLGVLNSGASITSIATALISGGLSFSNFENVMTYIPFSNTSQTYIVIAGNCTLTSVGDRIEGTFEGTAIQRSDMNDLSLETLISLITSGKNEISGSFTAIKTNAIADLFSK